ncbi:MAG TPA: G8 domain-containing protein, partial [Vicinamibacterales bacterium]|nr:G8 domain-containing protein [Vicinamibacterales bacterium]
MMITVEPTVIRIGSPDFVPRCLTLPRVLTVPVGQTIEPAADSTFDCVEVAGTLKVSRTRDTVLRFTHLFVLPGGVLDIGTQADPIPTTRRVEFIVNDVPLNVTLDPFQWGNGLLNFGRRDVWGAPKLTWTTLTDSLGATQRTVTLSEDPTGWRVGDELLFPDMDVPAGGGPRREPLVTVESISGRRVTLSKPLDFDHFAQFDPDGNIISLPYVANLTRNIILRSENPNGTRGHAADVGHDATWREGYSAFIGLGRTPADVLDSTTADQGTITHIGTKQVGRYGGGHKHHAQGFGSVSIGNVYRGSGPGLTKPKWALALHGTHDALIERNICVDFAAACFVTEDGYEVRNTFRQNFAAYVFGNETGSGQALNNIVGKSPGTEGTGFWLHGITQTIEGNVAINNSVGMNLFNINHVAGSYPSVPGGDLDTAMRQATAKPVSMTKNRTLSNVHFGLEFWGAPLFPNDDHVASYNQGMQVFAPVSDPQDPYLRRPILVGVGGRSFCIHSSAAYTGSLTVEGGRLVGCAIGVRDGGAIGYVRLTGVEMQNAVNIDYGVLMSDNLVHTNITHRDLPGFPSQYIVFGNGTVWPGGAAPFPAQGASHWLFQQGSRYIINNWQGTGKDFRLFEPAQRESAACWPSSDGQQQWNAPAVGLTMGQCWDRFGQAYNGEVLRTADEGRLPGVIIGLVAPGATSTLGPPRFIVTYPAEQTQAILVNGTGAAATIDFSGVLTGTATGASVVSLVSIDGAPEFFVDANGARPDLRRFQAKGSQTTAGRHEIKTWRVSSTTPFPKIAGSEMVFHYTVGATTPPVCVPPAVLVNGVCVSP